MKTRKIGGPSLKYQLQLCNAIVFKDTIVQGFFKMAINIQYFIVRFSGDILNLM